MKQFSIKMPISINGRLMSDMVGLFNKYNSKILVTKDGINRNVDGKSLCGLYSLDIHSFEKIYVYLLGSFEDNDSIDLQDQLKFLMLKY